MGASPIAAFAPAEVWSFAGVQLNQPYWNIATFGGARYNLPTVRGQNYTVPYRAGQLNRQKMPDQRTLTLTMWVDGTKSTDGSVVGDPRLFFNDKWAALHALLWNENAGGSVQGQLQRNWYLTQNGTPGLVTATAMAEIAGSMDPTMNGRLSAVASIDFLLSDPYFYGATRTQGIGTGGGTITTFGEGLVGSGFPSNVNSFTVTCSAPCTVVNTTLGISFTLTAGPAYPVTVDVLKDTVTDNAGVNQIAALSHAGSRFWMALGTGANAITNTAGTATFSWNDCYT